MKPLKRTFFTFTLNKCHLKDQTGCSAAILSCLQRQTSKFVWDSGEDNDGLTARTDEMNPFINMQSLDPVGSSFPHSTPAILLSIYTYRSSFQNNSVLFT